MSQFPWRASPPVTGVAGFFPFTTASFFPSMPSCPKLQLSYRNRIKEVLLSLQVNDKIAFATSQTVLFLSQELFRLGQLCSGQGRGMFGHKKMHMGNLVPGSEMKMWCCTVNRLMHASLAMASSSSPHSNPTGRARSYPCACIMRCFFEIPLFFIFPPYLKVSHRRMRLQLQPPPKSAMTFLSIPPADRWEHFL